MKIIQWTLYAADCGLSEEEIKSICHINNMKPLHEAFIKEMWFRFPELRDKMQLGVGFPEVIESGIIK